MARGALPETVVEVVVVDVLVAVLVVELEVVGEDVVVIVDA
jgi:hypothetical protein